MIAKIIHRLKRLYHSPSLEKHLMKDAPAVKRLGTLYGGWNYVPSLLQSDQWAMLCGAGEDVSFDLELQRNTGIDIVIVDPTPRAIAHWEQIVAAASSGGLVSDKVSGTLYDLARVDFAKIVFLPHAIWNETDTIRFWKPANPDHVSFSATNLQSTDSFIEVSALDPAELARRAGYSLDKLGLLKLDIEGAEGNVLDWFLARNIHVPQVLLEFDEMTRPSAQSKAAVQQLMERLLAAGYELAATDGPANALFIRR